MLNDQGQVIGERSYMDSIMDVRLTDIEISDERIYVTGQKWAMVSVFNHAFILVTDLDGQTLNYRELHVDSCFACESSFYDLELDSFGSLYGYGRSRNSDENVVYTWLRKFDCLGNDSTPPLSFDPLGLVYPGGSIDVWLQDEHFESHAWEVDGEVFHSDTLHIENWDSEMVNLTIHGSYCTLDMDTTLTLQLGLGIPQLNSDIVLFPNPARGQVILSLNNSDRAQVLVCNALGQEVFKGINSGRSMTIDVSNWATGTYIVTVQAKGQIPRRMRLVVE